MIAVLDIFLVRQGHMRRMVGPHGHVGAGCHAREMSKLANQVRLIEVAGAHSDLRPIARTTAHKLGQQRAKTQHAGKTLGRQTHRLFEAMDELARRIAARALQRLHACAGWVAAERRNREGGQRIGRRGITKPM